MRPKKLTIQGIGPFKEKTVIDFEDNNIDSGLLLLTGDTGSGKTSIFDAISYALYGETSGNSRNNENIRSKYSSLDEESYVEYEFYYKGDLYYIKRTPAYERYQKNSKTKTTINNKTVELSINNNPINAKASDINEKIISSIGLDKNQFQKVIMLAQGQFTDLLLAKGKDKTNLFRKIFDTQIIGELVDRLNIITNSKKSGYKNAADNLTDIINKIDFDCSTMNYKEISEALEDRYNKEEDSINNIKKEIDTLDAEKKKFEDEKKNIEILNENIDKFQQKTKNLNKLLSENPNSKEDDELLNYNLNVAKEIRSHLIKIEDNKNIINENEKELSSKQKELDKIVEEINNKKEDFKIIDDYQSIFEEYNKDYEKQNKYLDKLVSYNDYLEKIDNKKESLIKAKDNYEKELSIKLEMENNYDDAYNIALRLKDNDICPVCGNVFHKDKIKLKSGSVSKAELDHQIEKLNKIESEKTSLRNDLKFYEDEIKKLNIDNNIDVDETINKTKELLNDIDKKKKELSDKHNKLLGEKNKLESDITEIKTNITNCKNAIKKSDNTISEEMKLLDDLYEKHHTNLEEYNKKVLEDNKLIELKNKVDDFKRQKIEYQTIIDDLKDKVANKEKIDTKDIEERIKEVETKLKEIRSTSEELTGSHGENKLFKSNYHELYEKYNEASKEYEKYKTIGEIANGKSSNSVKMNFENFVQSYYIDEVLNEANRKLSKLTDDDFFLVKKLVPDSEGSKLDIEFEVYKNSLMGHLAPGDLSGGEKFKAALALALGISDSISMSKGGIKMDSLFIDEGFGSLDSSSLNSAMNVLNELAKSDKLIVVISHVEELKRTIDHKIVVSKTRNGSNIKITDE